MHRRTARGNRIGLALSGLLLVVAGAALFCAHRGTFGAAAAGTSVYPPTARHFVHDHGNWLWPVLAAVAIVLGLIFLRWLLVQVRVDRLSRLRVDTDLDVTGDSDGDGAGRTRLRADAISDVIEDDLVALRGVRRASVTVSGQADAPELWMRVVTDADADLARIRRSIVDDVVHDARECLDMGVLPTYVKLIVTRRDSPRDLR